MSQKLFGLVLSAEAAATLLDRDPAAAREQVERLQALAQDALDELRSLVFELRPPDLELDGLGGALRKHVELLRRLGKSEIELVLAGELRPTPRATSRCFRIAQEALQNAVKHAQAQRVVVSSRGRRRHGCCSRSRTTASASTRLRTASRSRRLGLTSMEERARAARRHARDPLRPGRRHDRAPGGSRWLSTIRVLVVDDHAVVREGLRAFLELQDGIEVVGEAADGNEAIEQAARLRPDVILMDLVMPELDGLAAMRAMRDAVPSARVIVLTSYLDDATLLPALRAGRRRVPAQERASRRRSPGPCAPRTRARRCSIRSSRRGWSRRSRRRAAEEPLDRLTPREREVLILIGRGFPNKLIARELGCRRRR